MRYGNFLQMLAIIVLLVLTTHEYKLAQENAEAKLYQLRVDRSYSSKYDLTPVYGTHVKQEIDRRMVELKGQSGINRNHMFYKFIAIIVLSLISIFHFSRYFYVPYDLEHDELPMAKYDSATWFLNFFYFALVSLWYAYFTGGEEGAVLGYILAVLCLTKCLWHISVVIQTQNIKKLTGIRVAEIGIATLIYFHLIGFVAFYYMMMLMGLPNIIRILRESML